MGTGLKTKKSGTIQHLGSRAETSFLWVWGSDFTRGQHSVGVLGGSGSLAKMTLKRAELDERKLFQKQLGHPGRKLGVYS